MTSRALQIDPRDNLAVALVDLAPGETVRVAGGAVAVEVLEPVAAKHKVALAQIAAGETAVMYGVVVGVATRAIPAGGAVTTGNLRHAASAAAVPEAPRPWSDPPDIAAWTGRTFDGFHREGGLVGTANVWLVVPLVFCENRNLALMRDALLRPLGYTQAPPYEDYVHRLLKAGAAGAGEVAAPGADALRPDPAFPHVDGVKFLSHSLGCGGTDGDAEALAGLLAGYVTHPNVAGTTVLSLGCQKTQVEMLERAVAGRLPGYARPFHVFEQQKWSSERELIAAALQATVAGVAEADSLRRAPAPLSKLVFGMECGGSDGFSGISANPLVGEVADRVAALGGRVMLAEFPELCGAEQDLVERCKDAVTARRFLDLMAAYGSAAQRAGSGFENNPSPGNVADGLITDAIKSCGAARKGGTSPVNGVLDYPEPCREDGLSLLCTPGGDVESTTALAGSGANLILFTTGLGTPTGNAVAPVVKIASNSVLAERHPDMIDFDAGPLVSGDAGFAGLADDLLEFCIRVASGETKTRADELGQDDFIPWKRGVSL